VGFYDVHSERLRNIVHCRWIFFDAILRKTLLYVGVLAASLDMCLIFTVSSPLLNAMNVGRVVVQNVPGYFGR
jgi:hypothetical protein